MSTAETILSPHLTEINFPYVDRHKKFFHHSELPGKLVREVDGQPVRAIKNEVRAMRGLVSEFEERYGIATAKPNYIIGPGDNAGEARAVIVCDEVPHEETAERLILSGKYSESLDDLNMKFIQHAKDLSAEGGVYNSELMYLGQYVMSEDTPVLVDVEPHFSRIIAPPEGRIYGDVEKVPLIEMAEAIVQNAIMLSTNAGHRSKSSHAAEEFLNGIELTEASMLRARAKLLAALKESSLDRLEDFIESEDDIEWQKMLHARAARTYVADL
jgi:hypothetical protein